MSGGELPSVKHKVVLLGDQSVGKTSIVARFMYDSFDQQYQPTIGIDFFSKSIYIEKPKAALGHQPPLPPLPPPQEDEDGTTTTTTPTTATKSDGVVGYNVRLHVWDTAGQERFRSLIPSYIRNSAATIIVYDIASRASFLNAFSWVDDVRGERGCGSSTTDGNANPSDANATTSDNRSQVSPLEDGVVIMLVGNKKDLSIEEREVSTEEAAKKATEHHCLFTEVSAKTGAGVKSMFREVARALPGPDVAGGGGAGGGGGVGGGSVGGGAGGGGGRNAFLVTPSTMRAAAEGQNAGTAAGGGCC